MNPTDTVKPWVLPTAEPEIPASPSTAPAAPPGSPAPATHAPEPRKDQDLPRGVESDSTHAYVWRRPAAAGAVLAALRNRDSTGIDDGVLAGMSPRHVAAAALGCLGIPVAARVLQHLGDDRETIRWAAQGVADEPKVTHAVALAALDYVRGRIEAGDYEEAGGAGYADELIRHAFGEARGRRMLKPDEDASTAFQILRDAPAQSIAPRISHEHPQTIALILSQLHPAKSAAILAQFPQRLQADVAYRMAILEDVLPVVIKNLEESLEATLDSVLAAAQDVGGAKVVADMLNMTGSSVEKNVLDQMDAQDPEVAEAVRNLMFTFADIAKLTDREIQVLLREVDIKDLVVSLKAAHEELKDKILGNVSEEVRSQISQEMEQLGPMRLNEVEEVQLRVVQQVRQLEEQGKLTIVRGAGPDHWV